jgi:hypothetical protein
MGKSKKKDNKFKKSLTKNINKLEKNLYKTNKYVTREEFTISKFTKPIKNYYNALSEERKQSFLKYVLSQEDYDRESALEKHSTKKKTDVIEYKLKSSRTLAGARDQLKKQRKFSKKRKKKVKNILKGSKGLMYLLNPEAYDQTLLDKKDYRKYLKKIVEQEQEDTPIELDCTLKNFHAELMKNPSVNQVVMDSFWNKHGYD